MEISAVENKIMTNNALYKETSRYGADVGNSRPLQKYLASIICDGGSIREVLSRAAQTMTALARLKTIWKVKNIRIKNKID